ncbi:MAG TPA: amylo-alpha-1,6-glucosidase [Dehalococcoidia bacterium]|nr:amylo-alpha-1,6-glucosidase [Dehalococcoidia bacterium]
MIIQDIRDALVVRGEDTFLLTDRSGNVPPGDQRGFGLYHHDTRYLSTCSLSFGRANPVVLLSTAEMGFSQEQVLTNPSMEGLDGRPLPRGTLELTRLRVIDRVVQETVQITNYNIFPAKFELVYEFGADFADIFQVRGYQRRQQGEFLEPLVEDKAITYTYRGADGRKRETRINFFPAPLSLTPSQATFTFSLGHRETATIGLVISIDGRLESLLGMERLNAALARHRRWLAQGPEVITDNEFFNAIWERSWMDLRLLWGEEGSGALPAAGVPWFDALFGRDTAIVALQTLAFRPELAGWALKLLARYQGIKFDPWRDEEPGKILHELRLGEMTYTGELPFSPYYGSVDATPLFLLLAGEYYRHTGDLELLRELEPSLRAALRWLGAYGDIDRDGYVEYEKRSPRGLVNQGWKDSGDAIVHANGGLVLPPTALVEVQGYVYAAKRSLAELFFRLGDESLARRLRREAAVLKKQFNKDFWLPQEGFYALALDGRKRPAAAISSNPGHALWSGIVDRERAPRVVDRLMEGDMFTGWGIRTLSSAAARFNPLGYHLGTVWPHDNAIVAMGFKEYGFEEALNEIATALYDAAVAFPYYRLPELFAGTPRSPHHLPVPYPVACRPQAWAAASMILILQAILGIYQDIPHGRLLLVRPTLPHWLGRVQVRRLPAGPGSVDILFERRRGRTVVRAQRIQGPMRVALAERWPL